MMKTTTVVTLVLTSTGILLTGCAERTDQGPRAPEVYSHESWDGLLSLPASEPDASTDAGENHTPDQEAQVLFVAYVGIRIFGYVLAPGEVSPDRMYAAISVYVLMGLGFALVFGIVESLQPGSFSGLSEGANRHSVGLLYYSLVTLTTLGYGEITPVAPQVRSLATIEAGMGVFYVAILVARLVALYNQSERGNR